jgi:hypothetical protein
MYSNYLKNLLLKIKKYKILKNIYSIDATRFVENS